MADVPLTFAELEYLLQADDYSDLREALRVKPSIDGEAMRASGVSSLFVRGLVRGDAVSSELHEGLSEVLEGLKDAERWVEIGIAGPESAGGVQIFDGPRGRFRVQVEPFGSLRIIELEPSMPLALMVNGFLETLFDSNEELAVFVKRDWQGVTSSHGIGIRRFASNSIEVGISSDDSSEIREVEDLAGALTLVEEYVSGAASLHDLLSADPSVAG